MPKSPKSCASSKSTVLEIVGRLHVVSSELVLMSKGKVGLLSAKVSLVMAVRSRLRLSRDGGVDDGLFRISNLNFNYLHQAIGRSSLFFKNGHKE